MDILILFLGFFNLLLIILFIIMASKIRKLSVQPRNKVRFYVKMVEDGMPWLYIQKRNGDLEFVACDTDFINFGLNPLDFYIMTGGEIKEVFLNTKE